MKRIFFILLFLSVFPLTQSSLFAQAETAEKTFPGVAEIIPMASRLSERAAAINIESADQEQIDQAALITSFGEKQGILTRRIEELGDSATWGFERLLEVRGTTTEQKKLLATQLEAFSSRLATLETLKTEWEQQALFWKEWGQSLKKEGEEYPHEEFTRATTDCKSVLGDLG